MPFSQESKSENGHSSERSLYRRPENGHGAPDHYDLGEASDAGIQHHGKNGARFRGAQDEKHRKRLLNSYGLQGKALLFFLCSMRAGADGSPFSVPVGV